MESKIKISEEEQNNELESKTKNQNDEGNEQQEKKKKKKKKKKPKIDYSQLKEKYDLYYDITPEILQSYNFPHDNSKIVYLNNWAPHKLQTFPPTQSILK